jgi:hypothetical protein
MADAKKPKLLQRMFDYMYDTEGGVKAYDDAIGEAILSKHGMSGFAGKTPKAQAAIFQNHADDYDAIYDAMRQKPLAWKLPVDGSEATISPLKTMGGSLWNNIKKHPGEAAGTGLLAAGNIAGLVDNDNLLGQVLGTAGGALLGSKLLDFGPLGIANTAMVGGGLGALFDALRSKKAQEEQYQQQYY